MKTKSTGIKLSFEPDTRSFFGQQCQDEQINKEFRQLHTNIVNQIIQFCKKHNISIDEIHLNADGVADSIPYSEWQPCTDSYFSLEKYSEEYKDVISLRKHVDEKEWQNIKAKQEPFIYSA